MKLFPRGVACVCALSLAVAVPAAAQAAGGAKLSHQDSTWLKGSIQTDLAEIQMGQLAEHRSKTPAVLKLAKAVIKDHTSALKAARTLAKVDGMTPPTTPSEAQVAQSDKLQQVPKLGTAFDRTFAQYQVKGHELAIKQTKAEIRKGSNSAIKGAARKALPMLNKHLTLARAALAGQ